MPGWPPAGDGDEPGRGEGRERELIGFRLPDREQPDRREDREEEDKSDER